PPGASPCAGEIVCGRRAERAGQDEGVPAPVLAASALDRGRGQGERRAALDRRMPAGTASVLREAGGSVDSVEHSLRECGRRAHEADMDIFWLVLSILFLAAASLVAVGNIFGCAAAMIRKRNGIDRGFSAVPIVSLVFS